MVGEACGDSDACDADELANAVFGITIIPYPAHAAVNSMLEKQRVQLRLRFTGQGVIYWKPVFITEYRGSF